MVEAVKTTDTSWIKSTYLMIFRCIMGWWGITLKLLLNLAYDFIHDVVELGSETKEGSRLVVAKLVWVCGRGRIVDISIILKKLESQIL